MMIKKTLLCLAIILLTAGWNVNAQTASEAADYMGKIGEQYDNINADLWDYTSTMVFGHSARKVERERHNLLKTIQKSIKQLQKLPSFDGDFSFRDSVIAHMSLNYDILNEDYGKIINMELVAEQSYDNMEAYLLAQELAGDKLEEASARMDQQYRLFGARYGVNIVESNDETSRKLKKAGDALKYYNKVFLVFFRASNQEKYLLEALRYDDLNSIEQNRNSLISIATENQEKLKDVEDYNGDHSLVLACNKMMDFFREEASGEIRQMADFVEQKEEYDRMKRLIDSKDRELLSDDEINKYNEAVNEYNEEVEKYNKLNADLNYKRSAGFNDWNNTVNYFMRRQVPAK